MRQQWTNLILHTTSLVHKKKEGLLTSHSVGSFFSIFWIIILEVFLSIISLPLYVVTKSISGDVEAVSRYKLRRIITLSILLPILFIWFLKSAFILSASLYLDSDSVFKIAETSETISIEYAATDVISAPIDLSLSLPTINQISQQRTDNIFIFRGTAIPNHLVVMYLFRQDDDRDASFKIYLVRADTNGDWEITQDRNVFYLPPGKYLANTVTYNEIKGQKSEMSKAVSFEIKQVFWRKFITRIDFLLNVIVLVFIILGIFLIVLIA